MNIVPMDPDRAVAFATGYRTARDIADAAINELVAAQRAFIDGDWSAAEVRLRAAHVLLGLDNPKE